MVAAKIWVFTHDEDPLWASKYRNNIIGRPRRGSVRREQGWKQKTNQEATAIILAGEGKGSDRDGGNAEKGSDSGFTSFFDLRFPNL